MRCAYLIRSSLILIFLHALGLPSAKTLTRMAMTASRVVFIVPPRRFLLGGRSPLRHDCLSELASHALVDSFKYECQVLQVVSTRKFTVT